MALAAKLSPYTIRGYERGTVLEPRFAAIRALAQVYAMMPEEIVAAFRHTNEVESKAARKLADKMNHTASTRPKKEKG